MTLFSFPQYVHTPLSAGAAGGDDSDVAGVSSLGRQAAGKERGRERREGKRRECGQREAEQKEGVLDNAKLLRKQRTMVGM